MRGRGAIGYIRWELDQGRGAYPEVSVEIIVLGLLDVMFQAVTL